MQIAASALGSLALNRLAGNLTYPFSPGIYGCRSTLSPDDVCTR